VSQQNLVAFIAAFSTSSVRFSTTDDRINRRFTSGYYQKRYIQHLQLSRINQSIEEPRLDGHRRASTAMDDTERAIQQIPAALRQLQPAGLPHHGHALRAAQPDQAHHLSGGMPVNIHDLDANLQQRIQASVHEASHGQQRIQTPPFDHTNGSHLQNTGGHYDMLQSAHSDSMQRIQDDSDIFATPEPHSGSAKRAHNHIEFTSLVSNPPNLEEWRKKLFDVDEELRLTDEQFQTYFPHIDNVYSHRSTQRYKRKPFVSHYYDCRLKGRPPGTPKSTDPNKKKRDRKTRERDQCDVKIKVTEHLPHSILPPYAVGPASTTFDNGSSANFFAPGAPGESTIPDLSSASNNLTSGERYWTIQRVNGNGGNGKSDGVGGPHRHSLEESDRIKRNTVQRLIQTPEGSRKKQKLPEKSYHKRATGEALNTVRNHTKESDLKLFGSCFCPFVQRVWIALEAKGIDYQYVEVDPYKKPPELLEVNPRGLVPAIRHGDWACYESTVLLDYLEDLGELWNQTGTGGASGQPVVPLFPPISNPQLRAHCRLWNDHINRHITPGFYRYLQAQDMSKQMEHGEELKTEISRLVDAADPEGPFFLGPELSIVDVQFAPWMLRLSRVLAHYRGWPPPEEGSRWEAWLHAIESHDAIRRTTSDDELYLDSYERYAGEP
jgi:glutathione S-transferase